MSNKYQHFGYCNLHKSAVPRIADKQANTRRLLARMAAEIDIIKQERFAASVAPPEDTTHNWAPSEADDG